MKIENNSHLPRKIKQKPKWFEKQILPQDFEIKRDKGNLYAHHVEWKPKIWIGPYKAIIEMARVIDSYVSMSKKPFGNRDELKNVHSIIIEENLETI